jgi:hypothetical protein
MKKVIDVYFDDVLIDTVYVEEEEAEEIAQILKQYAFSNYNEDVKQDWFNLYNGRDNPKVTVKIIEE